MAGEQAAAKAFRAWVSGRVQGVGFRDFACRSARQLGLVGYVRNLPDGRVEVVAEGSEEQLQAFLEQLRRGPAAARVSGVEVHWQPASGRWHDFDIVYGI